MGKIGCELIIKQIEENVKTLRVLVYKYNMVCFESLLTDYEELLIKSYIYLEKVLDN